MDDSHSMHVSVRLSIQRALLGEVSSRLRGVRVSYDPGSIRIEAFFDGKITEEDRGSMSEVETEVYADFPQDYDVVCHRERLDAPARIPQDGLWIYRRREDVPLANEPQDDP